MNNRDQISEEEWLTLTRSQNETKIQNETSSTSTSNNLSIPALVDEAISFRESDAKKRSAESTRALLSLNASLEAENESLQFKLTLSKNALVTLLGLLNDNNINVDINELNIDDILLDSSTLSISNNDMNNLKKISKKSEIEEDLFADVLTDGDGRTVAKICSDFRPHDKANILCVRVLEPLNLNTKEYKETITDDDNDANNELIVITGGADKRIVASSVYINSTSESNNLPTLIDSIILSAPVLCLDVQKKIILAGCMDGSLHVVSFGIQKNDIRDKKEECNRTFLPRFTMKAHEKYVTRVTSSPITGMIATSSSDKTLSLYLLDEKKKDDIKLHRLQQLFFAKGAVEAVEWAVEHNSKDLVIETLAISVRSSPVLYYLRFVQTSRSNEEIHQLTNILSANGFGALVPFLVDTYSYFPTLSTSTSSSSSSSSSSSNEEKMTRQLWLYRVPLSEDGQRVDCSWKSLYNSALFVSTSVSSSIPTNETISLQCAINDDDVRDLMSQNRERNILLHTIQNQQRIDQEDSDKDDIDGDAKRVREALRGRHITSTMDGELVSNVNINVSSSNGGKGYIRVGFTVISLACEPCTYSSERLDSSMPISPPLLALAADNCACYIVRFGSNSIIRTLVGHSVGSAVSASTKVAWHPQIREEKSITASSLYRENGLTTSVLLSSAYLAVTSESDFSIILYSIGSGRIAKKLGRNEGGHTGSIKDLSFVINTGNKKVKKRMVTVSFDKRCIVWE
jgi:hypothetical protein